MSAPDEAITLVPFKFDSTPHVPSPILFDGTPPPTFDQEDLTQLNQLARILLTNPAAIFPPPPTPQPNERSMKIQQAKELGNKHFRKGEWQEAIKFYSISAEIAASRPVFEANVYARDELALTLSNRSAAYMSAGEYVNALVDADAVILIKRPWVKGHFRRGKALAALGRLEEAREALLLGLQFDPTAEVRNGKRRVFVRERSTDLGLPASTGLASGGAGRPPRVASEGGFVRVGRVAGGAEGLLECNHGHALQMYAVVRRVHAKESLTPELPPQSFRADWQMLSSYRYFRCSLALSLSPCSDV